MKNNKKLLLLSALGLLAYAPHTATVDTTATTSATVCQTTDDHIDNMINSEIIARLSSMPTADVQALLKALNDVQRQALAMISNFPPNAAQKYDAWNKLDNNLTLLKLLKKENMTALKIIFKQMSASAQAAILTKIPKAYHAQLTQA